MSCMFQWWRLECGYQPMLHGICQYRIMVCSNLWEINMKSIDFSMQDINFYIFNDILVTNRQHCILWRYFIHLLIDVQPGVISKTFSKWQKLMMIWWRPMFLCPLLCRYRQSWDWNSCIYGTHAFNTKTKPPPQTNAFLHRRCQLPEHVAPTLKTQTLTFNQQLILYHNVFIWNSLVRTGLSKPLSDRL